MFGDIKSLASGTYSLHRIEFSAVKSLEDLLPLVQPHSTPLGVYGSLIMKSMIFILFFNANVFYQKWIVNES